MTTSDLRILSTAEINEELGKLDNWSLEDMGNSISRVFEFSNFKEAVDFINKIAELAEEEGHHPDISLYNYNKLRVKLSTHAVKGLTEKDFKVASGIDKV